MSIRPRTVILASVMMLSWLASTAPPAEAFGSSVPPPLPSVSAGGYMTCALAADGTASCWGENGVPANDVANTSPGGQATPPSGLRFLEVNAGYATGCGITVTQTLSCWGSGRGDKFAVPSGMFTHVAPGLNYVCALRTNGSLACWGGEDPALDPNQLIVTQMPTTGTFTQVTMGNRHACALRNDGQVLCWGVNAIQGGVSNNQTVVPPGTYKFVNSSNFDSCAVRTDDTVVCWGRGQFGQKTVPAGAFTTVSVGFGHVCGLRPDQTVTCWGRSAEGQTTVPPGTYTQVSAGTFHSCGMPTSGPPARCWGNNAAGRVQPSMRNVTPHPGYVATPYSLQLTMQTHVSPTPTFSVVSGALPPGLTLSPDGLIAGTPTEAGTFNVLVAASSLGLSPPNCVQPGGGDLSCHPDDANSIATARRSLTFVIGAVAPPPGSIAGQVVLASGAGAVTGATVSLTHSGGAAAGSTTTDGNGNYRFDGQLPGTYSVTVNAPELQPQTKPATVVSNQTVGVNFLLVPLIRPRVTGVFNNHFETVTDGLFVEWSEVPEQRLDNPTTYTIHTQAGCGDAAIATAFRGNWLEIRPRIRDLEFTGWQNVVPGGTYFLRVAAGTEFGLDTRQRNALQCVQFVAALRPADVATLSGRVTSGSAGIAGATVTVVRTQGQPGTTAGQATTDANGNYSITNLPPGPYSVSVAAATYTTQTRPLTLAGGVTTTANFNFGPTAVADTYTTNEDTPLTVPAPGVLANDTHGTPGTALTAGSATDPPKGSVVLNANGSFTYTPDLNTNGTDTFTYTVTDPRGDRATATVTITVRPVEDAPAALDDNYTTGRDTPLTVPLPGVLGNDTDPEGSPLFTNAVASDPPSGSVVMNPFGSFVYTPDPGFIGTDTFTYSAMDINGLSDPATVTITVTAADDRFVPLSPARLLDTRTGTGAPAARVGAGGTIDLQVTGRGGVPLSGVTAVALNVTAVNPTAGTFVTAWPAGEARPVASNVNLDAGTIVPNLTVVKVGLGGMVSLFNSDGDVDLLADVAGYYVNPGATVPGSTFVSVSPARILDTRSGTGAPAARIGAGQAVEVQVTGQGGVPATGVTAVAVNVTAVNPSGESFVTAWPTGETRPVASNLNTAAGVTRPNMAIVKVGAGGRISLFNDAGTVDLLADVAGYYLDPAASPASKFTAVSPARILDTRIGVGAPTARVGPGQSIDVQITGQGTVPATGVTSVVMNVTSVSPSTASFMTGWPTGEARPTASNMNMTPGVTVANLVVLKVGAGGKVTLYNDSGDTDLIADVAGYHAT